MKHSKFVYIALLFLSACGTLPDKQTLALPAPDASPGWFTGYPCPANAICKLNNNNIMLVKSPTNEYSVYMDGK